MVTAAMDGGGRPSGLQAALLAASAALTALLCSAYRHKARQARGLQVRTGSPRGRRRSPEPRIPVPGLGRGLVSPPPLLGPDLLPSSSSSSFSRPAGRQEAAAGRGAAGRAAGGAGALRALCGY